MSLPSLREIGIWAVYGSVGIALSVLTTGLIGSVSSTEKEAYATLALIGIGLMALVYAANAHSAVQWLRDRQSEDLALDAEEIEESDQV